MRNLVHLKLVPLVLAWLLHAALLTPSAAAPGTIAHVSAPPIHSDMAPRIQPAPPTISVTPPSGRPGAPFTIEGSHFVPGGEVSLYWDSEVEEGGGTYLGDARVGSDGTFQHEAAVPDDAALGDHKVIARGQGEASGQTATTLFIVIDPVITVHPPSGEPGSKALVQGLWFTPYGVVEVYWEDGRLIKSATTEADGAVATEIVIPGDVSPGLYRLWARDRDSDATAATLFRTTAQVTPTDTPTPTPTSTPSETSTLSPTLTPGTTPTSSATATPTPSPTLSLTATPTPTGTGTGTPTFTSTPTPTGTPTMTPTPCGPPLGWQVYFVQGGDTLYSLANRTGTTVTALKLANCLSGDSIQVGQKLFLPPFPPTATATATPTWTPTSTPTPTSTATPTSTVGTATPTAGAATPPPEPSPTPSLTATYALIPPVVQVTATPTPCLPRTDWPLVEVGPMDTLDSLARQHRLWVSDILQANCRPNVPLEPGERLHLPPPPQPGPNLWPLALAGIVGLAIVGAAYAYSQGLVPPRGAEPPGPRPAPVPPPLKAIEGYARVSIPGVRPGEPLQKDREYTLIAGLTKEMPQGFETQPVANPSVHGEVEVDLAVFAQDIEVLPRSVQHLRLDLKDLGQAMERFTIIPRAAGVKKVQLDFRYRHHWLQTVTLNVAVSDGGLAAAEVPAAAQVATVGATRLEAFAEIPLLAHEDYPVDVHVRIYPDGHRFRAEINYQRVPIELTLHDVAALNRQLREALCQILVQDTPGSQEGLRRLAFEGSYAFRRIFGHPTAEEAIRGALAMGGRVTLQIASEDFFVPWELLYDRDPDGPDLSYEHFWGMRHLISRAIVQEARPGAFVPPVIAVESKPKVGLLSYISLPSVVEREIPFFQMLDGGQHIILHQLRALDPTDRRGAIQAFADFWKYELDLAHFACHAVADGEQPARSYLVLTRECPISLLDMEVFRIQFLNHPLVILNACETGNLNPLYSSYFAAAFLRSGARGVVATEGPVPDDFASAFVEQLYGLLLRGSPLGDSLLLTRRHFLHANDDPSGLLYSLYAPPTIRIRRVVT